MREVWKAKGYRVVRVDACDEVLAEVIRYLEAKGVEAKLEGRAVVLGSGARILADGRAEGKPQLALLLPLAASKLALAYSLGRSIYLDHSAVGFGKRGRAVVSVASEKLIELKYTDLMIPAYYESGMKKLGFQLSELQLNLPKPLKI